MRLSIEGEDSVELTLDKLLNGIALAVRNGYAGKFIEDGHLNMDCVDGAFADCIIQFAVFGEVVYG